MRITKSLAGRIGELPTEQVRLAHGTLNTRDVTALSDAEYAVLDATTDELSNRGEDLCPECAGLTSQFTTGYIHTDWCPEVRQGVAS